MASPATDRFLETVFKIRPGELGRTGLMFGWVAFAVGGFVVGRSVRDALFLSVPSRRDLLPWMYVAVACSVAVVSLGYSKIADKFRRDRQAAVTGGVFALLIAGTWFLLDREVGDWIYSFLYVLVEVMGSLTIMQAWMMASDLFNSREAKRLFVIIGAGGTIASVVGGMAVGAVAREVSAESLLAVCVACLVLCAVFATLAGRSAPRSAPGARQGGGKGAIKVGRESFRVLSSPHLRTIALVVFLTFAATSIVDFNFKVEAARAYRVNQLAGYFGNFYAVCGILAMVVQFGFTGRILERFGLLPSLMALPAALATGTLGYLIVPGLAAAAITKGSENVLRYTMNDSSMQLLYVPLPSQVRGRAKAFVDGIVRPIAIGLAGLSMMGIKKLGPSLTPLAWASFFLAVGWCFYLVRAKKEYVSILLDTLKKRRLDIAGAPMRVSDESTKRALHKALTADDEREVVNALELLPQIANFDFDQQVSPLLTHTSARIRAMALDYLGRRASLRFYDAVLASFKDPDPGVRASAVAAFCGLARDKAIRHVRPLLADGSPAIRAAAIVGLMRHCGLDGILVAAEELKAMVVSPDVEMRARAAEILGEIGVSNFYQPVLSLIGDPKPDVQRAAIQAAGKLRTPELMLPLIYLLSRRETARAAVAALAGFGPAVLAPLGKALANPREDLTLRRNIPLVLARLGSPQALGILQENALAEDAVLREHIYRAISRIIRRDPSKPIDKKVLAAAVDAELTRAERAMHQIVDLELPSAWPDPIPSERVAAARTLLGTALIDEEQRALDRALTILGVLHPGSDLDLVAENLRSEVPGRRGNAIEVIDNTLPDHFTRRLLPILEGVRPQEQKRTREEILVTLFVHESQWVVACALNLVGAEVLQPLAPYARVCLTNHAPLVRESAVHALSALLPAPEAAAAAHELATDEAASVRRVVAWTTKRAPARAAI